MIPQIDENAAYHADTSRISKSGLDLIAQSPAHYYAKYLDPNREPQQPTKALIAGSVSHMTLFEPHLLRDRYFILDDAAKIREIGGASPRSTTRYKEWKAEQLEANAGKQEITLEAWKATNRMIENVQAHPAAKILLQAGKAEERMDWLWQGVDEDGNPIAARCKIKPDWQSHNDFIVDLKTTEDASPNGFLRSVYKYRYHVQSAFYIDGYTAIHGAAPRGFIFMAVEKSPPYAVALYFATPEMIEAGRRAYERDLQTYSRCLRDENWPAYSTQVMPLGLPAWYKD